MKTMPPSVAFQRKNSHDSGIALVIVLAMLVLLSGIMIAFISSANNTFHQTIICLPGFRAPNLRRMKSGVQWQHFGIVCPSFHF